MLDFLKANPAVSMLKEDHERVKDLFDQFEAAKSRPAKVKIVRAALTELTHPPHSSPLMPASRGNCGRPIR